MKNKRRKYSPAEELCLACQSKFDYHASVFFHSSEEKAVSGTEAWKPKRYLLMTKEILYGHQHPP